MPARDDPLPLGYASPSDAASTSLLRMFGWISLAFVFGNLADAVPNLRLLRFGWPSRWLHDWSYWFVVWHYLNNPLIVAVLLSVAVGSAAAIRRRSTKVLRIAMAAYIGAIATTALRDWSL